MWCNEIELNNVMCFSYYRWLFVLLLFFTPLPLDSTGSGSAARTPMLTCYFKLVFIYVKPRLASFKHLQISWTHVIHCCYHLLLYTILCKALFKNKNHCCIACFSVCYLNMGSSQFNRFHITWRILFSFFFQLLHQHSALQPQNLTWSIACVRTHFDYSFVHQPPSIYARFNEVFPYYHFI